jgi:uncharacterized protein GlcG (DUF336 family)
MPGSGCLPTSFRSAAGFQIKVGEETIGGVGLSGAPMGQAQEEACVKVGIAKVADQLR